MRLPLPCRLLALGLLAFVSVVAADPAPAVRTLYLVRHGYYDYVRGADSRTGNALNATGHEQARLVAERLASLGVHFTRVTSSEFTRARETGDVIAAKLGLPCARDGDLNECTPSGLGIPAADVEPGAAAQLEGAWRRYVQPASGEPAAEILACHGNVIRWFVCRALGTDTANWTRMEIANCSITIIQVRADGSTRLQVFNDVAHVPTDRQTWTARGPGWPLPAQSSH